MDARTNVAKYDRGRCSRLVLEENFRMSKECFRELADERLLRPFLAPNPSCFLENKITAHVQAHFSARAEIPFRLHEIFSDFQARLAGLKILARFKNRARIFSSG